MTGDGLALLTLEGHATSARLAGWRANVGPPASFVPPVSGLKSGSPSSALLVLSWNVWIGRGRLDQVMQRVLSGAYESLGAAAGLPLVVLIQEAFRAGDAVPLRSNGMCARGLPAGTRPSQDIVETARRLSLHLRYAPSMRNGPERSDRGNAILSTLPLADAVGIELPLVLQRRVAVAATVSVGTRTLRVVSAHLEPRGPVGHKWLGAAGRAQQARHLLSGLEADTVILGADLNLGRGRAEATWRYLSGAGFTPGIPPVLPTWTHTYHALPRLVIDYIMLRDREGAIARARVHRLDEDPADRGATVFGSDHHPLLARLELA